MANIVQMRGEHQVYLNAIPKYRANESKTKLA